MGVAFATEKLLPLMGQSQCQQHTGRQYLDRPFPKRLACFHKRSFQKLAFDNGRFLGMAVFRQCPKVMLQKVLDFENQLVKTSHCALNDCFGGHSKRNSQNTFRGRKVSR